MYPYDVTLTSCGRFDLLARTLDSLLPRLEGPVGQILIREDSGDRAIYDAVAPYGRDITVLFNRPRMGQIKSIDLLYSHVRADWIFHCEDDWEFLRDGFIAESFALLKEFPDCSMVGHPCDDILSPERFGPVQTTRSGLQFRRAVTPGWAFGGIFFGPGLRRIADYRLVGPYAAFGAKADERRVSMGYMARGFWVAVLKEPPVRHIGDGRRVRDWTKRTWLRRRWRKARHRFELIQRKLRADSQPLP